MEKLVPSDLMQRVRSLPGAPELLARLAPEPQVHLVGGAVRDLLLHRVPRELDLLVEGDPELVAKRLGGAVRSHDRFGTSTVSRDGFTYDLARARRETYDHPGALPSVVPAGLTEDLSRRDFTVNAAAIALTGGAAGSLTTVPGALADLLNRALRVMHDGSFRDDPTRLLRMARYAARLGFEVEPHTRALAYEALAAGALGDVSGTRIGNEVRLLAREDQPIQAFATLGELGLSDQIIPGLAPIDPALADRALALLPADGRRDLLVLGLVAARRPVDVLARALDWLAFDAGDRNTILEVAAGARVLAEGLRAARRPSEIEAAIAGARPETVAVAGALGAGAAAGDWLTRLRHVQLEIDGGDLLAAGVQQGPRIGAGLRAALAAKLDGRLSGREQELAEAVRAASATG